MDSAFGGDWFKLGIEDEKVFLSLYIIVKFAITPK